MAAQHWCEGRPPRAVNRAAAWQDSASARRAQLEAASGTAKVANHGTGLIRHHTPLGDPVKDGWLELFNSNGLIWIGRAVKHRKTLSLSRFPNDISNALVIPAMVKDLIVTVDQDDAKMGVFKKPKPGRNSIFDKNMPGRTHKLYRDLMLAANPGFVSRRASRVYVRPKPQSYRNVSRETFWYDWHTPVTRPTGLLA